MNNGFPSLSGAQDDSEEGFWSSFSNVILVILKIFLLVIIVMALNNRNLLDELKHSVRAQEVAQQEAESAATQAQQLAVAAQKSAQVAEFQLKANATLEEQLDYLQQRSASLEMDLLRSRAEAEETRTTSSSKDAELSRLQALTQEQASTLTQREQSFSMLQTELASKNTEALGLRTKVDESEKKLLSIQGELTELDQKYQKLLQPARSAKGKKVVEVMYSKSGYSIRKPGESAARSVSREALEGELAGLKAQHSTELYVKVVIPDNSGLSYNEAWRFTNDMLTKYDYYTAPP
jgi:chromosome segregation ATPase